MGVAVDDGGLQREEARAVPDRDDLRVVVLEMAKPFIDFDPIEGFPLVRVMHEPGRFLPEAWAVAFVDGKLDRGRDAGDREKRQYQSLENGPPPNHARTPFNILAAPKGRPCSRPAAQIDYSVSVCFCLKQVRDTRSTRKTWCKPPSPADPCHRRRLSPAPSSS